MAQLVIKGHPTCGKEVIEILEMLGGANLYSKSCSDSNLFCYLSNEKRICELPISESYREITLFTLEEFLEKFPYKVGDRVKTIYGKIGIVNKPIWSNRDNCIRYELEADTDSFYFINELQPYKEEPMYLNRKVNEQAEEIKKILEPVKEIMEEIKLDIPNGYEFFGIDDDNKIVLTKKQSQYPKTYEECCKIMGAKSDRHYCYTKKDKYEDYPHEVKLLDSLDYLRQLLICRDAYWKIAGEQTGLGKPWKPQFENCSIPHYCIFINHIGEIYDDCFYGSRCLLAFPTEEMRDAFLENFKELIELCKELL